jgi:hypothetical protein
LRRTNTTPTPLDPFIPDPDVRERFQTTVRAPADVVMAAAAEIDMQSIFAVRAILRLRELLLRAPRPPARTSQGLLAETRALGWGLLAERPGRLVVCGAACRPWLASPEFVAIPPEEFAAFAQPDQVKIAWTLEVEPLGPARSRLVQETRVAATDAAARARFRRYWRWARFGIVAIRLFLLPAVRKEAERRWSGGSPGDGRRGANGHE